MNWKTVLARFFEALPGHPDIPERVLFECPVVFKLPLGYHYDPVLMSWRWRDPELSPVTRPEIEQRGYRGQ